MGAPKFSRKQYDTPSHPWQADRIKAENELIKKYGLKNKREIWKARTKLRNYRGQARELRAKVSRADVQSKKETDQLLSYLNRMNILPPNSKIDDVLGLGIDSILSRRLQTLTYLKGLASTPTQARQLISHGHILIGDTRITIPGYLVTKDEEAEIGYTPDSPLNDLMHPARPRADFKSAPIKKEIKLKEPKEKKLEEQPSGEEAPSKPEQKEDKKPKAEKIEEKPKEPAETPKEEAVNEKNEVPEDKSIDKKEGGK